MRQLGFEELMDLAFKARKLKDLKTLKEVNEEFNYRVERRIKLKRRVLFTPSVIFGSLDLGYFF